MSASESGVFEIARQIQSEEARLQYVHQVCGDDEARRARILQLLENDKADSFMERPGLAPEETIDATRHVAEEGQTIGRYKLLQQIGEGGFGVVYMAEQQQPVRRKVALKVIKPGMDTGAVIARFEAERQALAMMDHPNIARVLDAGATDQGRPYFVMELVKGIPVTDYCDKNGLSTDARLELFVTICRAVQHAHQKGIIHRDLKPANVMVTLHDGKPVPKVIDFGVSKAISQQLTEKTLFTAYGQMIGTPQYMSPEQAEMSGLDVDTQSDVYSLGVLLYELLTGSTPLGAQQLSNAGYAEILRLICDEEPLRPSTRLSTLGEQLTVIANQRNVDPHRLRQLIQGELDWIVMKSLEKERGRRYESANSFAADVERYLRNEAVEACPPSGAYKLQKFIGRHRGAVIAVSSLIAVLCLGLAGTTFGLVWASREAERARLARLSESGLKQQALDVAAAERLANSQLERNFYVQLVNRAQRFVESGRYGMADAKLAACATHLRGWESRHLHNWDPRKVFRLDAHEGAVRSVAFSPDGRLLASGGGDGRVLLWDIVTGRREIIKAPGDSGTQQGFVWSVGFRPDGQVLAAAVEGQVQMWSLPEREPLPTFAKHEETVYAFAFSPDSSRLVEMADDLCAHMWDVATGTLIFKANDCVGPLSFDRTGNLLICCTETDDFKALNSRSGELIRTIGRHRTMVEVLAFNPASDQLVTGDREGIIKIWDALTSAELRTLQGHVPSVHALAFSPDGNRFISAGPDGDVKLWYSDGEELLTLPSGGEVATAAFSPGGNRIAAGLFDGRIIIWDATSRQSTTGPQLHRRLPLEGDLITDMAFTHDGRRLVAAALDDDGVEVWDLESGTQLHSLQPATRLVIAQIAISPDDRFVALSGDSPGDAPGLHLWDLDTGRKITLRTATNSKWFPAFSPGGQLAMGEFWNDGAVQFWNAETGQILEQFGKPPTGWVQSMSFSPDGRFLAGGHDWLVSLWRVDSGEEVFHSAGHENAVFDVAYGPRGNRIASTGLDGTVCIWNAASGKLERRLIHHFPTCERVAISPDGQYVAAGGRSSGGARVVVWNIETGQQQFFLEDNGPGVAFSGNGKWLATNGSDSSANVWDFGRWTDASYLREQD